MGILDKLIGLRMEKLGLVVLWPIILGIYSAKYCNVGNKCGGILAMKSQVEKSEEENGGEYVSIGFEWEKLHPGVVGSSLLEGE